MTAEKLLSELRTLDIQLIVEGDRLRCNAPKGRLTGELEQEIAARKTELIRALRLSSAGSSLIRRRMSPGKPLPLSFAQERFWFLQNFDTESTMHNITVCSRVNEVIHAPALEHALRTVVDRHEILRTRFPEVDGTPVQVVLEAVESQLALHDLRHLPPSERTAEAQALVHSQEKHRFDLAQWPLFRMSLIRLAEREEIILLTAHHIVCDAWSIAIFSSEVKNYYQTYASGHQLWAAPLALQYGDYAVWERDRAKSDALAPQLDYWKNKLTDLPDHLNLPMDRPRTGLGGYQQGLQQLQLERETSELLTTLGHQEGATPFMVLLAVFQTLLSKVTKQNDIVIGTPVSTRAQASLEQLIGCFINTQVLRSHIHPGMSARQLIAQVRTTVLESLANADVPFEKLVNALVTQRDLSRTPLFQVAFLLLNMPIAIDYEARGGGMPLDMALCMGQFRGQFGGVIEFNGALFDPETILCFAGMYKTLAAEMASRPDVPLEQLALITAAQEENWFGKYDGAIEPFPELCVHEWIEQQVEKTPNAVAVTCGSVQLTFRQLLDRADRLAGQLRAFGITSNSLVALCLDRSINMILAPLAVWKAGASYIPLDPEFPRGRLAFMLEDSAAVVVITESQFLDRLPEHVPNPICLDRDQPLPKDRSAHQPGAVVTRENLAYVIYTSGSTGRPKGVAVTHRALVNLLASMQREPGMSPNSRLLAVTTFSFDIAGLELFLPLVTGAQVIIAPRDIASEGATLAQMLAEREITIMQATPATWRMLLDSGWRPGPNFTVLCGGEVLTTELADQLLATGAEVWNLYGPTETTIWSALDHLNPGEKRISIGRPIANTQVYVLDESGSPVPLGVTGELYIGGEGVSAGYLHRPELTAEKFVASAFHRGKRLYRTGDLVRRLSGGRLEYVGRADHQVKLRGHRIELEEIEAVLERQGRISQAIVILREDIQGDPRLTAYLTTADKAPADAVVLRRSLLTILPAYMVPADFVTLDLFPLTPNFKVDRAALRAPEFHPYCHIRFPSPPPREEQINNKVRGQALPEPVSEEPCNHVELTMARIWREVLGLENVGLSDNFFQLGGHSLSAVRLMARLRVELEMELPLRCIFLHPTIRELANHIAYSPTSRRYAYSAELPKWNCMVPAQPKGSRPPLFFVAGYQNVDDTLLILSRLVPFLGADQPVFGFRPRWLIGGDEYATVEELAREFLAELRAVQPKGPYLIGGQCVGGIAALEMSRILRQKGEETSLMLLIDTERPSRARTVRRELFRTGFRIYHIAEVLTAIWRGGDKSRIEMIKELVHHKLGRDVGEAPYELSRLSRLRTGYQRLLCRHNSELYPGKVSLIVNQERDLIDKNLGWDGFAVEGLDTFRIPGNHDTMFTEHAEEIASVILNCLHSHAPGSSESNLVDSAAVAI